MKSFKLKKIVAAAVAAMTIATISPVGASAKWKQNSTGWWNTEGSSYSTGWRAIDNAWYYFGQDGYMQTGWVNNNGTWYFTDGSGAMQAGWINNNGTWYITDASGAMKTGWVSDGGKWYLMNQSGAMQTGWVNDNGTWYFTNASGAMQTGVVEVNGKVYSLATSGAMQTGEVTIDGVKYTFAITGEAIGEAPKVTNAFNANGTPVKEDSNKQDDKDKDKEKDEERTHGGGGGGSHHSSSTVQDKINSAYFDSAKVTSSEENGKHTFNFVNDLKKIDGDYAVRDLYITNNDGTANGISYSNGIYTFEKGNYKVKSVIRVVRDGKIYYVTQNVKTIEAK
ncbi:N-acetylmuramoyl-L-alanine amidase family protein [Clostridium sp. VAP41]|uniref:N-acetylmuramoyl-L-alanine amidase family protein n=1 Tax=Clostridium sp. VAP41 TaxID=2949979 RepID=UPI00207A12D7|nr:N-acetylmuramoyl-L-alanine amidase family protein [Clostridium sp. VAP41]